jgi:dinuclear metal center YbgI/SA1388 family protein
MKLKELVSFFNEVAPFSLQESYDNSGLQTGDPEMELTGAVICLDVTVEVLDEALSHKMNLIIAHHPVIFGGLHSLTGRNQTEQVLLKAIKNDVAILAVHTNLDTVIPGVNDQIANKLGLINRRVLDPLNDKLIKLVFFVPIANAEQVRQAVFEAGAGVIGEYDYCSYNMEGEGTFRASEKANPYVGEIGKIHKEKEIRVETILPEYIRGKVISALLSTHPYEEVAYDLYPLKNIHSKIGMGIVAELKEEMEEYDFLMELKQIFNSGCVRYTKLKGKKVKKLAICGGSGSSLLKKAISAGADVFVSADFKYHQFFEAENRILIADIGHYESEQFTKELFYELVTKKFPKFALRLSEVNTNPINYL